MSASFPHIHPGWPSQCHRVCVAPPFVSSLRGGNGKIISGEHLDHLFRAPGVSRKPNYPDLCAGVVSSCLALQVGHECEPWKVHQAGCQRASSQTNTNATWRSSCEQCESAKCMINWACQGALWLWSAVAGRRHCYDCGYLGSWKLTVYYWQPYKPDLSELCAPMNSSHIVRGIHRVSEYFWISQNFEDMINTSDPGKCW